LLLGSKCFARQPVTELLNKFFNQVQRVGVAEAGSYAAEALWPAGGEVEGIGLSVYLVKEL
jgi:hypothetical protein